MPNEIVSELIEKFEELQAEPEPMPEEIPIEAEVIDAVPEEPVFVVESTDTLPIQAQNTALKPVPQKQHYDYIQSFDKCYNIGTAYASASLVPKNYQNRPTDCAIAVDMAMRVGLHPLMVMQNMYVVQGRPSWSGQACIAMMRNMYNRVKAHYVGTVGNDDWGCYYTANGGNGEEIKGSTVTIAMAKKEGWYQKPGSKWQSMPEQMLAYRAAAFFVRANCPEVLMGCSVEGEAEDIAASRNAEFNSLACADCGKPFKPCKIQKQDGTVQQMTAIEIFNMSKSKNHDGVARCSACMAKINNQ